MRLIKVFLEVVLLAQLLNAAHAVDRGGLRRKRMSASFSVEFDKDNINTDEKIVVLDKLEHKKSHRQVASSTINSGPFYGITEELQYAYGGRTNFG